MKLDEIQENLNKAKYLLQDALLELGNDDRIGALDALAQGYGALRTAQEELYRVMNEQQQKVKEVQQPESTAYTAIPAMNLGQFCRNVREFAWSDNPKGKLFPADLSPLAELGRFLARKEGSKS